MGCICSKGFKRHKNDESPRQKEKEKPSNGLVFSSKREEVVDADDGDGNGLSNVPSRLVSKPLLQEIAGSTPVSLDEEAQNLVVVDKGERHLARIISMPNAIRGAQVAAGWPPWLTTVAAEAIKGWIPRKADSFEKLEKIGQGTYSNVYRARDLESGKIVALKKVRFVNMDPESVRFMAREIYILRKLDHPNVIKLEGLITSRMSSSLYLVLEYMEHDLAGLAASLGTKFTEPQIKCYMQQLLRGLDHCHRRGILHRDIKGSNLLIDNNGILKITDFGLATTFFSDQKQTLTSRVVTLWYRPPELLLGATEYGVAVDLWSSGCILAELLAGKPIMPGRTEVEQLHKIFKLCGSPSEEYWRKSRLPHATIFKPQQPYKRCVAETFKDIPPSTLALLDVLLAIEPEYRGSAASALTNEFFTTKPLPCDPSSLPKCAPSKEFDAKLRNEEARRQRAARKGRASESGRKDSRGSKAVPEPDANAQVSLQKSQGQSNPKRYSEKYNLQEDGGSGFPMEPAQGTAQNGISHSSSLMHPSAYGSSWNMKGKEDGTSTGLRTQRSYISHEAADLSNISGLVASRISAQLERNRSTHVHPGQQSSSRYYQLEDNVPSGKLKWTDYLSRPASSHKKVDRNIYGKESMQGSSSKKSRIHHSGPLMRPGGNIDDMLKEHERHIQEAVRKARFEKVKSKD